MADTEQIQSPAPFSSWVGVVLLFVLFGVIVVAVVGPAPRGDTYEKMRADGRMKKLQDLRDEDSKALSGYSWIDKNKGTVRLPIERAMELTIAELANKKPAPAGPIATPEAAAAPGGVAAATPAPIVSPQSTGTPKPTSVWNRPRGWRPFSRPTSRSDKSTCGPAFDPTGRIGLARRFPEIIGRSPGDIAFINASNHATGKSVACSRHNAGPNCVANSGTTMKMSILPNE